MCVQDTEPVNQAVESPGSSNVNTTPSATRNSNGKKPTWRLRCQLLDTQMENSSHLRPPIACSFALESIDEEGTSERQQSLPPIFVPKLSYGEWDNIGERHYMEDTHVCINDLAQNFGRTLGAYDAVSFYGVFDGHGGTSAAEFVRDCLPRFIVEDADFPLALEKVVIRSFNNTDAAFAESCLLEPSLSSGTTAITALICGRSLLVANVGDCRAVLSRRGFAMEMSKDHRPCCSRERTRVESLGGYIVDGYLNGQLSVTRALGDWHLEGMKEKGGPLSAEPETKVVTLSKEDEFLIIGSDGIWDMFSNQNAVDFSRRRLQDHNDVNLCSKEMVEEAIKRGARDNLTVVIVSFQTEPPPSYSAVQRPRIRRCLSAESLDNLRSVLQL